MIDGPLRNELLASLARRILQIAAPIPVPIQPGMPDPQPVTMAFYQSNFIFGLSPKAVIDTHRLQGTILRTAPVIQKV